MGLPPQALPEGDSPSDSLLRFALMDRYYPFINRYYPFIKIRKESLHENE